MVHRPRDTPIQHGQERPYATHLFVCTSGTDCPYDGPAQEIRDTLKKRAKQAGLKDTVRVNNAGCLNQCGHGPMMVVYPEGVWYSHLTVADAEEVFDQQVVRGEGPVERLRYRLGPGGCKAARDEHGKSLCDGTVCRT